MSDFGGVLGHERPISILRRALETGRAHHAYLFVGPEGVGKRRAAEAFSRALNCASPGADPCERCNHCLRIAQGNHPDVVVVEPDRSKARPVVRIEAVRELIRQVHFKPYEGKRRVIVVDDAESLTEEAANALLKTLEEPTGETLFVLVTSRPHQLLTTIRSRCQPLRFAPLSRAQVQGHLQAHGQDAQQAELLAAFSQGSIGQALRLAAEGALDARREIIEEVVDLEAGDTVGAFNLAGKYARAGAEELQEALASLKLFYRDVVLVRAGADPSRVVNVDLRAQVARSAERLTVEAAIGHIERLDAVQGSLRAYIDAQLLLEDLFMTLASGR